jgi:putative phosphoribosyl transferase
VFRDRVDAGRQLARRLAAYTGHPDVIVLALPRGGVPIAAEIATALQVPFDVFLVRKIGVPAHEELAMGALAEGGVTVLNQSLIAELGIGSAAIEAASARERVELERRARIFRGTRAVPAIAGQTVILVDDGLATGASMEAAVLAVRAQHPAKIVVAVPVGARETCARFKAIADEVVIAETPEPFTAVGLWYDDFTQLTDEDVLAMLPR